MHHWFEEFIYLYFLKRSKLLCYLFLCSVLISCSSAQEDEKAPEKQVEVQKIISASDSVLQVYPDSALGLAKNAYRKSVALNLPSLQKVALIIQGRACFQLKYYDKAQEYLKKALSISPKENNALQNAQAYRYLGASELKSGQYLSAIINLRKAVSYSDGPGTDRVVGEALEELGDLFFEVNYLKTASKYYGLAKGNHEKNGDKHSYYKILAKIGHINLQDNKPDEALSIFQEALNFYLEEGDKNKQALIYQEISKIRLLKDEPEAAIEASNKAVHLADETSNLELLLSAHLNLGKIYLSKNEHSPAKDNLLKSLELFEIVSAEELGPELYKSLATVFEKLNHPQQSLAYYKEYAELAEGALKANKAQKSKEILAGIKQDKSRKEIIALKKRNEIIEKYSALRSQGLGSNRNFIILLTAFVVLFVLLVALYYKRFIDKKKVSKKLEKTVKKRTIELDDALQKLSFHVNNTSIAVIELDSEEKIKGWSLQSEQMFGWSSEEVLGTDFLHAVFFNEESLEQTKKVFKKIHQGHLSKKFVLTTNQNKAGNLLFVEWNFSVLYSNKTGRMSSILCFANDVTHRERALIEAETANKELDNFIYKTSHDVKGPIARIEGLINLGLIEAKEPVSQSYFQMLNQVASNFNIVLSRLFRIHGIYNHEPDPVQLSLNQEISLLLEKLQKKNSVNELSYKVDMVEEILWNTDKLLFYIIIQNIYENALDYRRDGLSMIIFSAEVLQGEKLKLRIRDNGTCIPLQAADRVFDMFFQNTAQSNTAGLGLYMVKKSVEKLGGSIKLLEEKNETIFEIFLPAI